MRSAAIVLLAAGFLALNSAWARARPPADANNSCDDLDTASLIRALQTELPAIQRAKPGLLLRFGRTQMTLGDYARFTLEPLLKVAQRGRAALCASLSRSGPFERVPLISSQGGHVTAYYHPLVQGSRTRQGPFQHPLYRRPSGPSAQLSTAEILAGGLDGQGLEVVYLDSLGAALNLHIEGSATVRFADGSELNLTTDGHNGHPYQNPFKLARKEGVVPAEQEAAAGKSKTRAFFDANPDLLRAYWARNAHFVFFKETPLRGTGKFGQLVAGRSVAVDAERIPLGAALWLRSELTRVVDHPNRPRTTLYQPIARLVLAQDTGAAIRGEGRIDLFVGSGEQAAQAAAFTSRPGDLYLIIRRQKPHRTSHHGTGRLRTQGTARLEKNA